MLANAMKSYPGAADANTRDCALEGSELFGSTKRKLNLPPGVDCDSHRPDKVNYCIPRPNTRATRQRIEKSLSSAEHGVAHTTSVLETDCLVYESDKFIHASTYAYNEVMQILELTGVVEYEYYCKCCVKPHV